MSQRPLVLNIDDDPSVTRVLQLKLERGGYRAERALTAEEGFEKIQRLHPDVVTTDVKMPGMSGIELCRLCEDLQRQRPFLVIVLTSQIDPASREWLENSEHRMYASKPFSPKHVLSLIDGYFASRGNLTIGAQR